jgi:hypothetical protein
MQTATKQLWASVLAAIGEFVTRRFTLGFMSLVGLMTADGASAASPQTATLALRT